MLLSTVLSPSAYAGSAIWVGTGASDANGWGQGGNWSGGVPANDSTVFFVGPTDVTFSGGASITQLVSRLDASYWLNSLTFNAGSVAKAFTITEVGSDSVAHNFVLHLLGGGITNNTSLTQTINAVVQIGAATTFNAAAAGGTISLLGTSANQYNYLSLGGYKLTVTGPGDVSIVSPIIETGQTSGSSIAKTGTGTLTLSGSNSYTGGTTVMGGTLSIGSENNMGTGSLTLSGGVLQWTGGSQTFAKTLILGSAGVIGFDVANSDANFSISSSLTGTSSLTKTGAGTLTLTGTGTYKGGTTVTGGILAISSENQLGTGGVTLNGGVLQSTNYGYSNFTRNYLLGAAGGGFDVRTDTGLFLGGNLTGNGGLLKSGGGVLVLNGADTFTGGATITDGTVDVSTTLGNGGGNVAVGTGANLHFDGASKAGSAVFNNQGTIDFYGTANAQNATIASNGLIYFDNTTTAGSATITLTNYGGIQFLKSSTADNATIINNGISLSVSNSGSLRIGRLSGTGYIYLDSGNALTVGGAVTSSSTSDTISGQIFGTGSLNKSGAGTLTLSGDNGYSGGTTVSGGILSISSESGAGTGDINLNGGTLQWTGGSQTFAKAINPNNAASTVDIANAATNLTINYSLGGTTSGAAVIWSKREQVP